MTCIKTGADVWLAENRCLVHGDLFLVGETYILALGGAFSQCSVYPRASDTILSHITAHHYTTCGSRCIAFTTDDASDFFHAGYTHPVE